MAEVISAADPEKRFHIVHEEIGKVIKGSRELVAGERRHNESKEMAELEESLGKTHRKWDERSFQIVVLALVKSGKSTLINALLGQEFLPANNVPCTAQIVRVRHRPDVHDGRLLIAGEPELCGAQPIRDHLRHLNDSVRHDPPAADRKGEVVLEGSLLCLADRSMGSCSFEVLDTPGPNEAGAEPLRARVYRLMDEADVIVYLLDYTKLKTVEEENLLEKLKEMRSDILQRYPERLFFLVNKMDQKNRNGLSEPETAAYVAKLFEHQLRLTIPPERIAPVSAEKALLARLVIGGKATRKALDDFAKVAFGDEAEGMGLEECRAAAESRLLRSKVPQFEEQVLEYIYRERGTRLLQVLLDDLWRDLSKMENYLVTAERALTADQEGLGVKLAGLQQDLKKLVDRTEELTQKSRKSCSEFEGWVRDKFANFSRLINAEVEAALAEQPSPGLLRRGWNRLVGMVKDVQDQNDPKELQRKAKCLNESIFACLQDEFEDFRMNLEREGHDRQQHLFAELARAMEPVKRQVEEKVGGVLNVTLIPIPVHLPQPGLEELHQGIDRNLQSFVRDRQREEEYRDVENVWDEGGFCQRGSWKTKEVAKMRKVTDYSLAIETVRSFWQQSIEKMTQTSVDAARSVVVRQVEDALKKAREEVKTYADGYVQTIQREMKAVHQGKEVYERRLVEVSDRLKQGKNLRECVEKVPGVHDMMAEPVPLRILLGMPPEQSPFAMEQVAIDASNALLSGPVGLRALRSRPLWRRLWEGFTGIGQERIVAVAGDLHTVQKATLELLKEVMAKEASTQYCVNLVLRNLLAVNTRLKDLSASSQEVKGQIRELCEVLRAQFASLEERIGSLEGKIEREALLRRLTSQLRAGELHPGTGDLLGAAFYMAQVARLFDADDTRRRLEEWHSAGAEVRKQLGAKPVYVQDMLLEAARRVQPVVQETALYLCGNGSGPALSVVAALLEREIAGLHYDDRSTEEAVKIARCFRDPEGWLGDNLRRPQELVEQLAQELLFETPG